MPLLDREYWRTGKPKPPPVARCVCVDLQKEGCTEVCVCVCVCRCVAACEQACVRTCSSCSSPSSNVSSDACSSRPGRSGRYSRQKAPAGLNKACHSNAGPQAK